MPSCAPNSQRQCAIDVCERSVMKCFPCRVWLPWPPAGHVSGPSAAASPCPARGGELSVCVSKLACRGSLRAPILCRSRAQDANRGSARSAFCGTNAVRNERAASTRASRNATASPSRYLCDLAVSRAAYYHNISLLFGQISACICVWRRLNFVSLTRCSFHTELLLC